MKFLSEEPKRIGLSELGKQYKRTLIPPSRIGISPLSKFEVELKDGGHATVFCDSKVCGRDDRLETVPEIPLSGKDFWVRCHSCLSLTRVYLSK